MCGMFKEGMDKGSNNLSNLWNIYISSSLFPFPRNFFCSFFQYCISTIPLGPAYHLWLQVIPSSDCMLPTLFVGAWKTYIPSKETWKSPSWHFSAFPVIIIFNFSMTWLLFPKMPDIFNPSISSSPVDRIRSRKMNGLVSSEIPKN